MLTDRSEDHQLQRGRHGRAAIGFTLLAALVAYGISNSLQHHQRRGDHLYAPAPTGSLTLQSAVLGGDQPGPAQPYELWATEKSSASTGQWFEVSVNTNGRPIERDDSFHMTVGDVDVIVTPDPDSGALAAAFEKNGDVFTIDSFGWKTDDLARLVKSIGFDNGSFSYDDPFFDADHRLLLDRAPTLGGLVTEATLHYADPTGRAVSMRIDRGVAPQRDLAIRFKLSHPKSFEVNGQPAVAGSDPGSPRVTTATWTDGDAVISLSGTIDRTRLIDFARTVRPVSVADFNKVRATAESAERPGSAVTPYVIGGQGRTSGGNVWSINVRRLGESVQWSGAIASPGTPERYSTWHTTIEPSTVLAIHTYAQAGATFVIAQAPLGGGSYTLRVAPTGLPAVQVPLAPSKVGRLLASTAIREPVPFTAELIDDSGKTVMRWPLLS